MGTKTEESIFLNLRLEIIIIIIRKTLQKDTFGLTDVQLRKVFLTCLPGTRQQGTYCKLV